MDVNFGYDDPVKIGSICTGIGGLDLAAEYVFKAEPVWFCEFDGKANSVLETRYPNVPNFGDVTATPPSEFPPVDVLTAGYPCQPFSLAGQRKGSNDERHIWPYIKEIVDAGRPKFVVLENVRGHLTLGFNRVLRDLASIGYDASWCCLSVESVGGVHRRDRLFVLAWPSDATGDRYRPRLPWGTSSEQPRIDRRRYPFSATYDSPSTKGSFNETAYDERLYRWAEIAGNVPYPVVARDNGAPSVSPQFAEWMMGYPAGWVTGVDVGLSDSQVLKLLGNAVCPQAAEAALWRLVSQLPD